MRDRRSIRNSEQSVPREVNRARTVSLRVVFAVAILLLPLELVVQRVVGQPYPGVYQPSFAATPLVGDTLTARVPIVHVTFADGTEQEVPFAEILPEAKLLSTSVFKSAFFDEQHANEPATVAYLRELLGRRFPEADPTTMVVDWTQQKIDVRDPDVRTGTVTSTVVVQLRGAAE